MRLSWQCPTCYAQIGDKSHARMITCPFCGSLLIVNPEQKKFYRVPRENGWYYFSKINTPGYIKFGGYDEIYIYKKKKWYLIKNENIYILHSYLEKIQGYIIEKGKVKYIWGDLPFVAPPKSILKTAKINNGLIKITSREFLLFLNLSEKFSDSLMKLTQ